MSEKLAADKLPAARKWLSVNQWARNEPNEDGAIDVEAPSRKDDARQAEKELEPTQRRKVSSYAAMASPPSEEEFSDYWPDSPKMPAATSAAEQKFNKKKSYGPVWTDSSSEEEAAAADQINGRDVNARETLQTSTGVPRDASRPGAYHVGFDEEGEGEGFSIENSALESADNPVAAELVDTEAERQNVDDQVQQGLQRELAKAPIAEVVPKKFCDHRRTVIAVIVLAILVIVGITLGVTIPMNKGPPPAPVPSEEEVVQLLLQVSADGGEALQTLGSPQQQALVWLLNDTFQGYYTDEKLIQRFALATVFYSTNGDAWQNSSMWLDNGDECGRWWQHVGGGLGCDSEGAATAFNLNENGLSGRIPEEIGLLSALKSLQLKNGAFQDSPIPEQLGKLTLLENLNLQSCDISGSIPVAVANITTLKNLYLSQNAFSGPFIENIGKLSNLEQLSLYDNALNSSFPNVSKLTNLKHVNIRDNMVTGSIPTEIGHLSLLSVFHLYKNLMTGKIPSEIGLATKLSALAINNNAFTGSIPNEMSQLNDLEEFFANYCRFSGTIPSTFSELSKLQKVNLRANRLTGVIPDLSKSSKLTDFIVARNELTSTIPSTFSRLSSLDDLSLNDNQLTGTLPNLAMMTSLRHLTVDDNAITGTLSTEVGLLVALTDLNVQDNLMNGDIPSEIYSLTNLKSLNMGNEFGKGNSFRGSISSSIERLTTLGKLKLNNIQLFGTIPSNIGQLTGLNDLSLQNNMLTGSIPDAFDNMRQLDNLYVCNNNLTGNFVCPEWIKKCFISCDDPLDQGCRSLQQT